MSEETTTVMADRIEEPSWRCSGRGEQRTRRGVRIGSVAIAMPDHVVPNAPIAERLGVTEEWIVKRVGVHTRRFAAPGESLTDLAATAGRRALMRAGLSAQDLDMVLVGTSTADELLPNAAPLVATRLGAGRIAATDVGAGCAGFLSALTLAAGQVETGRSHVCLVIGAEFPSRVLNRDDKRTAALMGDGAGAVVLTGVEGQTCIGPSIFRSDGRYKHLARIERSDQLFVMEGGETFQIAVQELVRVTRDLLDEVELDVEDVDLFVYHQANGRILRAVGERLGLTDEQVVDCIAHTGNTSAASIPIALEMAQSDGRLRSGARVLMATIGTGFVWGATLVEWETPR